MNSNRSRLPWSRIGTMMTDIAMANLAVMLAFLVRFLGFPPAYNWQAYVSVAPWLSIAVVVLLGAYDLYPVSWISPTQLSRKVFPVVVLLGGLTVVTSFLLDRFGFPRSVFVLSAIFDWPLLYWSRRLWQFGLFGRQKTRIIVLTSRPNVILPDDLASLGPHPRITVLDAGAFQTGLEADLFLLDDSLTDPIKLAVLNEALSRNIRCLWQPSLYDTLVAQAQLTVVGQTPFLAVDPLPSAWVRRLGKRTLDAVIASLLLILSLPFDILIALAILLDDGPPIIYRQDRITAGNHAFAMLKFRTLDKDYEQTHGQGLTVPGDPGVTRVGRILRASHLDEIPQLWNVLRGEMSLVGPRPERPHYVEKFSQEIPPYNLRHQIKPGITGLAQLSGHYLSSPQEKLQMDLTYSRHSSIWMDLKILLQTVEHLWKKPTDAPSAISVSPSEENGQAHEVDDMKRPS
ncbi:MAG: sugar transferase [Firmicutes bacterium]|nr:sugar transferase [Bacillota bacterium]MCL5064164.1 sugar transferase [Bacillota bacterium]